METQKWHRNKTAALNNQILDDDNKLVAVVVCYNDGAEMTNDRINLIAAAPELLSACEQALEELQNPESEDAIFEVARLEQALINAISKAKGKL